MKRRILLFMMTVLLSVGAGAQSLQTVTIFENAEGAEVRYNASLSLNDAKQQLRSARVGSQLIITLSVPSGAEVFLYGSGYGYETKLWGGWQNAMNGSLSCLLTADAISAINNDAEGYGLWIGGGASFTVTKVTLNYNGLDYLYNAESFTPNKYDEWNGALQLDLTNASVGDVLAISFSKAGGKLWFLSGQGNPEALTDVATLVDNASITGTTYTIEGSVFDDITVGQWLEFTTNENDIEATINIDGGDVVATNHWYTSASGEVTSDNIDEIKTNGIKVTVASGTTLTVKQQEAKEGRPTIYETITGYTTESPLYIPITETMKGYSGLYLSGETYTASSIDLIYAPIELANAADNTTTISDWKNILTDVTLAGRTLTKNGNWNTLCLPFALTSSQIAASPLAGATIKELDASSSDLAADGTLTLVFTDASSIEAGKPYIVKWASGENVSNPLFKGVTITATTPTAVEFTNNASVGNCKFVGQFSPFPINDGNIDEIIMLGSGNRLGYSQDERTLKTFRAHFEVPTTSGGAGARAFVMNFGDEETTGIISVQGSGSMVNGSDAWYSLGGQRLQSAPTAKGVYIQNGRKVVVK